MRLFVRIWRIHRRRQKKTSPPNVAEKITVFLILVTAFIGGLQARIYYQQKQIMESSGHQTQQLIDAANIQAGAATSFSVSADKIKNETHLATDQFRKIADANERYLISQQRPYVFVSPAKGGTNSEMERQRFDQELKARKQIVFDITAYNEGISPAIKVYLSEPHLEVGPTSEVLKHAEQCSISYGKTAIRGSQILPPQSLNAAHAVGISPYSPRTDVLTDEQISRIQNGTDTVMVFGGAKYSGLKGGNFSTKYCFTYNPTGIPFSTCGGRCTEIK